MTEDGRPVEEGRPLRSEEGRRKKAKDQRSEVRGRKQMTEDGGRMTDDRRSEDKKIRN